MRYLGGGGGWARVFFACKLLPPAREKTPIFLAINLRQFFFMFRRRNEISFFCRIPYYVRYHLVVFLVNIFFINFDNKLFFLPTFSTNIFFLTFVATNYLFHFFSSPPPPPQISNSASKVESITQIQKCRPTGLSTLVLDPATYLVHIHVSLTARGEGATI